MFNGNYILSLLLSIPGLLLAISLHEAAHGYAAYLMGDRTAKYQGRLSLNPLHHLDPMGAICMLLFHFGWAKPVPINPYNFKNHRAGIIVVSLAGPVANFLLGLISELLMCLVVLLSVATNLPTSVLTFFALILTQSKYMNVGLMIFNLIPIPPLDGSKILLEFLPYRAKQFFYTYERYSGLILLILVYVGTLTPILGFFQSYVLKFYELVSSALFGFIM